MKDEALKLALEALEEYHYGVAQIIIREALSQPKQKRPQNCGTGYCSCIECVMEPPQRPWVGLTDEDTFKIAERLGLSDVAWVDLMQAIEAALKDKNT
jgi:hypothetical protein